MSSCSKFSASTARARRSRGAATAAAPRTSWSKKSCTSPTDCLGPNTTSPIQRPRGVSNAESKQLCDGPWCTSAREPRRAHQPGQLLGRGHDGGAERGRGHHVERAGEAVLGHDLPRRGHEQHEPRRRLGEEASAAALPPRARARASGELLRRASSISRRRARGSRPAPATATSTRSSGAGTASERARSRRAGARRPARVRPAASVARASRATRLAVSAATAAPSMPSIERLRHDQPVARPTRSCAPRTPRHPGDALERRRVAGLMRRPPATGARPRAARSAMQREPADRDAGSRTSSSSDVRRRRAQKEVAVAATRPRWLASARDRGGASARAASRETPASCAATAIAHLLPSGRRQPAAEAEAVAVDQQQAVLGPLEPGEDGRAAVGGRPGGGGRGAVRRGGAAGRASGPRGALPGVASASRTRATACRDRLGLRDRPRGRASRCSSAAARSPARK